MVKREYCDSSGYERYDEVFVERVGFPEDGEVEEHDGEEFAGFGENEGYVVDVGEGGVAEWGGEGGGYGNQQYLGEDGAGREDGWSRVGGGEVEVDVTDQGGEGGLDCV